MTAEKRPLDINLVFERLRVAVQPFPPAAMFQLAEEGHNTLFEQLVACILSIRTYDEVSLPAARRLLALARTPAEMSQLTPAQIDAAIADCTFHEAKAPQIQTIAQTIVTQYNGELPCDFEVLTAFKGVGPKCANLSLGIACGLPAISVDTHVHRVTNRWGYVQTRTPEQTMAALAQKLPQPYWIEINRLLVPFGKHICTASRPRCSTCPLLEMCQQVGVTNPR
jgi:endonuclease III